MKYLLIVGCAVLCWISSFWLLFSNPGSGYPRAITLIDENNWSLLKAELRKDPSLATRATEHEDSSAAHALITGRTECFHVLEPYYSSKEATEERWLIFAIESGSLELVEHCLRTYCFDNRLYPDGEGALFGRPLWTMSLHSGWCCAPTGRT